MINVENVLNWSIDLTFTLKVSTGMRIISLPSFLCEFRTSTRSKDNRFLGHNLISLLLLIIQRQTGILKILDHCIISILQHKIISTQMQSELLATLYKNTIQISSFPRLVSAHNCPMVKLHSVLMWTWHMMRTAAVLMVFYTLIGRRLSFCIYQAS